MPNNYQSTKLTDLKLSDQVFTIGDFQYNLSSVQMLDSDEVGQLEIVETLNAILKALKNGETSK